MNGPTRGTQAVGEYEVCSSEIRKANYSNAYYSQVLDIAIINSDQLSAEEFKAAAAYAASAISRANEKYEMSKAWLWLLIITASIGSTVAMWATLAAADWILAG